MIARPNPLPSDPNLLIEGKPIGRLMASFEEEAGFSTRFTTSLKIPKYGSPVRNDLFVIYSFDRINYQSDGSGPYLYFSEVQACGSWDLLVWQGSWRFRRTAELPYGITIVGFLRVGQNLTRSNRPKYPVAIIRTPESRSKGTLVPRMIYVYRIGTK